MDLLNLLFPSQGSGIFPSRDAAAGRPATGERMTRLQEVWRGERWRAVKKVVVGEQSPIITLRWGRDGRTLQGNRRGWTGMQRPSGLEPQVLVLRSLGDAIRTPVQLRYIRKCTRAP